MGDEPEPQFDAMIEDGSFDPKNFIDTEWENHPKVLEFKEKEESSEEKEESSEEKEESSEEKEESSEEEEPEDPSSELLQESDFDNKTISQHRKAFVKWVNENFYEKLKNLKPDSSLKIYQLLVQKYLSIDTPYRGLLVYHGLGTGKTATAISLAEGLSGQMRINTLLPASLESNFITEIMGDPVTGKMGWGKDELNKNNKWEFVKLSDIDEDFKDKYKLDGKSLRKIQNATVTELRKNNFDKNVIKDGKNIRGFFIPKKDGKTYEEFKQHEKEFINQEINYLIRTKYNFIHYNPFPKVKSSMIDEFKLDDEEIDEDLHLLNEEEQKVINTNNKRIVKDLETRLKFNRKTFNVDSPFYGECVVIDEVHNFVREILNPASKPSKVFYNWIINAENVKLVFLSGTPIINKPSEIAVLYNMLKGLIKIYSFTIITNIDTDVITKKLNDIFYKKKSLIELFYVEKKKGKCIISFIQERTGFESIMDPEDENQIIFTVQHSKEGLKTFDEFISQIYSGLHKIFKDEDITPSKQTFDELSPGNRSGILKGKQFTYDKDLNIPFNRRQKLFDILVDDVLVDMTNNENFMNYFFEGREEVPDMKRILMKRMLMGLTSYYPIDRTSIVDIPSTIQPDIHIEEFKNYKIVQNLNVVPCMMSQTQFEKYTEMWSKEKSIDALARMRNYDEDSPFHYHMRTRQTCNIVYHNDDFRTTKKTETNAEEIEDLKAKSYQSIMDNQSLKIDKDLKNLSPKMYQIMNNIDKFMKDTDGGKIPTGKILFYSDFRSDGGSEAFELVLKSNGYEKFNTKDPQKDKGKRYTFITGSESQEERQISKDHFNHIDNKRGENIQIMIISSAGAEGISLTCVRQVHILEPFWNYVRIDQVLGRAIRMRSHLDLPKEERNVEQYLYLSVLPNGISLEDVYKSLKNDINQTWVLPTFPDESIKTELSKPDNRETKEMIDNIIKINTDTNGESADIHLFEIMEKKYRVSLEINSIIKESSLDCIQHTRDDPELNDKCIRFSDKLTGEIAYFPGISAKVLENIDVIQLKAKYLYHLKPNIYVISASNDEGNNVFIYYEYKSQQKDDNIDIRYIRENGKRLCDLYVDTMMILNYADKDHSYNNKLGKEFSVYQEIYKINDTIIDEYITIDKFPPLKEIINKDSLLGYKLKYNVNDTFYYMGLDSILPEYCIQRIYPYTFYEKENYKIDNIKPRVIYKGDLYIKN